jgi:hypothetical protein
MGMPTRLCRLMISEFDASCAEWLASIAGLILSSGDRGQPAVLRGKTTPATRPAVLIDIRAAGHSAQSNGGASHHVCAARGRAPTGRGMTEALPAVDAATLARLLGVRAKDIYDLMKAGVLERGAGKLFDLEDSVRRYCAHLRGHAAGTSSDHFL